MYVIQTFSSLVSIPPVWVFRSSGFFFDKICRCGWWVIRMHRLVHLDPSENYSGLQTVKCVTYLYVFYVPAKYTHICLYSKGQLRLKSQFVSRLSAVDLDHVRIKYLSRYLRHNIFRLLDWTFPNRIQPCRYREIPLQIK